MAKKKAIDPQAIELARLAPLFECMGPVGAAGRGEGWSMGILSVRTVVYGSGRIARSGEMAPHEVDPDELERCRSLAARAGANGAGPMESEGECAYHVFFVAAAVGEPVPDRIDEALIRDRFGGAILPVAPIKVQPLDEKSPWWSEMMALVRNTEMGRESVKGRSLGDRLKDAVVLARSLDDRGERPTGDEADPNAVQAIFRQLRLNRLLKGPEFRDAAYVEICDSDPAPEKKWPSSLRMWPVVFLRLFVGLTQTGSLAGVIRSVVRT